jgi:hypothetical protein
MFEESNSLRSVELSSPECASWQSLDVIIQDLLQSMKFAPSAVVGETRSV